MRGRTAGVLLFVLASDIVWTLRDGNYVLWDTTGPEVAEGQFNATAVRVRRGGVWRPLLGHDDDATVPAEAGEGD